MKLNRKLVLILALVLSVALATGGTLAYLSDTDADVNVMTLGNVYIVQNEQERGANGALVPFTPNKPAYPAVGPIEWATEGVELNGTEYKVFTDELKNVIDKFVTVTNTGNSDAYVRTIVAIEAPDYDPNDLIHINVSTTGLTNTAWAPVEIDGVKYVYSVFTYDKALAAKATSHPSLMQLFLDSAATNADVAKFGDTWEVLVLSQAVQTAGFDDAKTALDTAFNAATAENVKSWFTGWSGWTEGEEIGSPNGKLPEGWEDNNQPEFLPTTSWQVEGKPDTSWYDASESTFTLNTASELAGLAKLVNEGTSFSRKTVTLGKDIDLADHEWTPIGTNKAAFQGTFDGADHTISNIYINQPSQSNQGLFGMTTNGEVKNLTVDTAKIAGRLNVGVVCGTPYTSKYTNITVTGLIRVDGMSYVGGVGGKNAYANWADVTINADAGSYVNANSVEDGIAYRTYVGGAIGFIGEGKITFTNVKSNIDVTGSTIDAGGITGIAHYGNAFVNCSSSGNVTLLNATEAADAEEMGGIAGVWYNQSGTTVTFDGCSFTGTLTANITEGVDLSDNTITGKAYNASGSGELIIK